MIRGILVEGPDCSGKSTLVNRIKNMLKWDSKSLHHKEGNQFTRYLKEYAFSDKTVIDRGHISEEVYSNLWRGGSPFSEDEKEILDKIISNDFLVIFACPKTEVLEERYFSRNYPQQIKLEELKKSKDMFVKNLDSIPKIVYLSENFEELDNLINKIKEVVK